MNGTRVIGIALLFALAPLAGCSEKEAPAPKQEPAPPARQEASPQPPERQADEPARTPQTPREARREPNRSTERSASTPPDASGEPLPEFVVPVEMQPALTIKRSGEDDIGVRALGRAKGVQYYLPQAWSLEKPSNDMRLVQLRLPPPEGTDMEAGVLVMYAGIGGSVYDNLNRWLAQVDDPIFTPQVQIIDFGEQDPLHITQVVMFGTLKGGAPGGPSEDTPDMGFYGAIVEGAPGGTVFVKATGPREVMEHNRKVWDYFVRTLRALLAEPKIPGQ